MVPLTSGFTSYIHTRANIHIYVRIKCATHSLKLSYLATKCSSVVLGGTGMLGVVRRGEVVGGNGYGGISMGVSPT
jgi:hypothetical protein